MSLLVDTTSETYSSATVEPAAGFTVQAEMPAKGVLHVEVRLDAGAKWNKIASFWGESNKVKRFAWAPEVRLTVSENIEGKQIKAWLV